MLAIASVPASFSQTLRSLEGEGPQLLSWVVAAVLLSAWGLWIGNARIVVYAVSAAARLEATGAARPAECPVQGRIVRKSVALGQSVKAGDLLVELDDPRARHRLRGAARTRCVGDRAPVAEEPRLVRLHPEATAATAGTLRALRWSSLNPRKS